LTRATAGARIGPGGSVPPSPLVGVVGARAAGTLDAYPTRSGWTRLESWRDGGHPLGLACRCRSCCHPRDGCSHSRGRCAPGGRRFVLVVVPRGSPVASGPRDRRIWTHSSLEAGRTLWKQDEGFDVMAQWNPDHRPVPGGVVFSAATLTGNAAVDPPIVYGELKRRGSRVMYTVVLTGREDPQYQPVVGAFYPNDFQGPTGPPPPFDQLPFGCYKFTWWGWDSGQNRKVLVARERFPIFAPGRFRRRDRRCAGR
jgi:hypothetical protein